MKINKDYILREIAGEHILIPVGDAAKVTDGVITLNPVAAVIWKALLEKPEADYALERVLTEFDTTKEEAEVDLQHLIEQMELVGLISRD